MSVLFLQDLEKTVGAQEILGGVGLRIDHGGRVEVESTPGEGSTSRVLPPVRLPQSP